MFNRGETPDLLFGASERLVSLVEEYFEDPEVREVGYYVMFHWHIAHAAERGIGTGAVATADIPPEMLKMVMTYDANMTTNSFFLQNFAAIKMLMAQDALILNSMTMHVATASGENEERGAQICRDLAANRYNALSVVALLSLGMDTAKQFDYKLREIVTLTSKEKEFFDSKRK